MSDRRVRLPPATRSTPRGRRTPVLCPRRAPHAGQRPREPRTRPPIPAPFATDRTAEAVPALSAAPTPPYTTERLVGQALLRSVGQPGTAVCALSPASVDAG